MAGQPGQELVDLIASTLRKQQGQQGHGWKCEACKAPPPMMHFRKLQSPKGSFSPAASYWGPRVQTWPLEAILILTITAL